MGLRLVFLIVTRIVSLLGLSRREAWHKDAEILMLRHQLAVAQDGPLACELSGRWGVPFDATGCRRRLRRQVRRT
jgi:hypothetical protein